MYNITKEIESDSGSSEKIWSYIQGMSWNTRTDINVPIW